MQSDNLIAQFKSQCGVEVSYPRRIESSVEFLVTYAVRTHKKNEFLKLRVRPALVSYSDYT